MTRDVFTSFDLETIRHYLLVLAHSHEPVRGEDASDIVQRTLLVAFAERDQFRGETAGQLAAWLKQILRNQLIDARRRQLRKKRDVAREVPLDDTVDRSFAQIENSAAAVLGTVGERLAKEEQLLRLADAMTGLSEAQREAIVLHHLQGLSLAETAVRLDRSPAAVAGLLHRGLAKLRETLTRGNE